MAETIKRYTLQGVIADGTMFAETDCGHPWVAFDDHASALAAKEEEIERLRSAVVFAYHVLDTILLDTIDSNIETVAGDALDMLEPIVDATPHPVKPLRPEGG